MSHNSPELLTKESLAPGALNTLGYLGIDASIAETVSPADLIDLVLEKSNLELQMRALFSLRDEVTGFPGDAHSSNKGTGRTMIRLNPSLERRVLLDGIHLTSMHGSMAPRDADRCCDLPLFDNPVPQSLVNLYWELSDEERGNFTSALANKGKFAGGTISHGDLQASLKTIENTKAWNLYEKFESVSELEGEGITIQRMLHPHGEFHSPNKLGILAVAQMDAPEASHTARLYLWQLLSNHEFNKKEDPQGIVKHLKRSIEMLNAEWSSFLQGKDPMADLLSEQFFTEDNSRLEQLKEITGQFSALVSYRKSLEKKAQETAKWEVLASHEQRGAVAAKQIVIEAMLPPSSASENDKAIDLAKQFEQATFNWASPPGESARAVNYSFEEGFRGEIGKLLGDEKLRKKVDIREVAVRLAGLHGIELEFEDLMSAATEITGKLAEIDDFEGISHQDIAISLIAELISELAEAHDIPVALEYEPNSVKSFRERGFGLFNMRLFEGAHGEEGLGGYHLLINSNTGEADLCADHSAKMDLQLQEATEGLNEALMDMPDVEYAAASEESRVVAAETAGGSLGQRYYNQQGEHVNSGGYSTLYRQEVSTSAGYKQGNSRSAQASNRSDGRSNYSSNLRDNSSIANSKQKVGVGKPKTTKSLGTYPVGNPTGKTYTRVSQPQPNGNVNNAPYTTVNGFDPVIKLPPSAPKLPVGSSYLGNPGRQTPVFTERSRAVSSEKAQIRQLGSKIAEITEAVSDRTSSGVLFGGVNTLGQTARVGKTAAANNIAAINAAVSKGYIVMQATGLSGFSPTSSTPESVATKPAVGIQTAQSSLAIGLGGGQLDAYNTRMAVHKALMQ